MTRYLLDTNVLSEPLKRRPDSAVLERLRAEQAGCATCAPVIEEMLFGMARLEPGSRRRRTIERYAAGLLASAMEVLPYDVEAARWLAFERARLRSIGEPAPHVDGLIAAIARANDLTLVTRNVRDFARFEGLRLEDWSTS